MHVCEISEVQTTFTSVWRTFVKFTLANVREPEHVLHARDGRDTRQTFTYRLAANIQ